jgi:hypothetical protein
VLTVEKLEAGETGTGSKLAKRTPIECTRIWAEVYKGIIISSCLMPCPCSIALRGQNINSWLEKFRVLGARNNHTVKADVGAGGRRIREIIIYFAVAVVPVDRCGTFADRNFVFGFAIVGGSKAS